jgi:hypothetical protein
MPSTSEHLATAKRFRAMYDAIPPEFPEGRALALFYSAMHYVEAVAALSKKDNRVHPQRKQFIIENHPTMWKFYEPLMQSSEKARYMTGGAFTMNAAAVEDYLRKKHHVAIERWALSQMPASENPEPKPLVAPAPPPIEKTVGGVSVERAS